MLDFPILKQWGVTPAKLTLIAVLAVVLVGVIALQWPRADVAAPVPAASASVSSETTQRALAMNSNRRAAEPDAAAAPPKRAPWPELTMQEIVQNNPFLLPASVRPTPKSAGDSPTNPQDAYGQQILQELSQAESGILLMAEGEALARIGAKRIHTGDKIGPYRVSKIDATGVWLVDESQIPK